MYLFWAKSCVKNDPRNFLEIRDFGDYDPRNFLETCDFEGYETSKSRETWRNLETLKTYPNFETLFPLKKAPKFRKEFLETLAMGKARLSYAVDQSSEISIN